LSLLQLLAQASNSGGSDASSSTTAAVVSDKSADDDSNAETDPNALTLAMLSQTLAAAFGVPMAIPSAPPASTSAQNAAPEGDTSPAAGVDDATNPTGSNGAAQQILSLLGKELAARDLATAAQGNGSANASEATAKSPSDDARPTDSSTNASSMAQSLAQMGPASHSARDINMTALKAPVGSSAWTEELGGQLTWMTHRGIESGSLRVSPEHLGPVEVQISVQNGDASVWFGASHPDTRAALEQALPRLREMFANQGLTLTDSGVSREPPRNQSKPSSPQSVSAVSAIGSAEVSTTAAARIGLGLVDTYA
jgi:flagellar hook-length control protein FliK